MSLNKLINIINSDVAYSEFRGRIIGIITYAICKQR
jgi:hypothetical protein